jgi:hypothetical protein
MTLTAPDRPTGTPRAHLPAVDRAIADLTELADLVVGLALLRDPEYARPWRPPVLDAYRRAELDHEARIERLERSGLAPGEHADAARADVLDILSGVLWRAEDLAYHLARAARCPVLRPPAADADPRPYLRHAAACLPTAVLAWTNGDEIAWWAADLARDMIRDVTAALALVHDGQRLKVVCPWCGGGLTGAQTWRVRTLPGDLVAIVCEGDQPCEPPSKDVGTWWRGRPAWPFAEWEWLAKRISAPQHAA